MMKIEQLYGMIDLISMDGSGPYCGDRVCRTAGRRYFHNMD